ncbi:MAG: hypothetical protein O2973_14145, partial [Gemmatimonadetes bacterium]|nr:hypothetical protein [Gemmatimonadota bacterium]
MELHRRILRSQPLLKDLYLRCYAECLPAYNATKDLGGEVIEISSGAGIMEEVFPTILKTEAVFSPFAMKVVDAVSALITGSAAGMPGATAVRSCGVQRAAVY